MPDSAWLLRVSALRLVRRKLKCRLTISLTLTQYKIKYVYTYISKYTSTYLRLMAHKWVVRASAQASFYPRKLLDISFNYLSIIIFIHSGTHSVRILTFSQGEYKFIFAQVLSDSSTRIIPYFCCEDSRVQGIFTQIRVNVFR